MIAALLRWLGLGRRPTLPARPMPYVCAVRDGVPLYHCISDRGVGYGFSVDECLADHDAFAARLAREQVSGA